VGQRKPVDWGEVLQVAAGGVGGAASAYAATQAQDAALDVVQSTNWPLIIGVGLAGIGLVYVASTKRR